MNNLLNSLGPGMGDGPRLKREDWDFLPWQGRKNQPQDNPTAQPTDTPSPDMSGLGPFASLFSSTFYNKPVTQTSWGGQATASLFNPFLQGQQPQAPTWLNPWFFR